MKKWKFIMLIPLFYLGCPMYSVKAVEQYKQTSLVVVSDNIGESFDAAEIKKYKLFPKVKGFVEARLYNIEPGGYELEVTTASAKLKAIYGEEQLPQILKDYIENFDSISRSDSVFKNKWQIAAFDEQKLPITMNEVDSIVRGHEFYSNLGIMTIVGCLGGVCIGAIIGGIGYVAYGVAGEDYNFYTPVYIGAAVCATLNVLMSLAKGKTDDRGVAIKAIKKSRRLKRITKQ